MPSPAIASTLSAFLADGRPFVPGASFAGPGIATCSGPDEHGECPLLLAGRTPTCDAATWMLRPTRKRTQMFRFFAPLHACPVTLLTHEPPAIGSAV
jgi:hypothetical protein